MDTAQNHSEHLDIVVCSKEGESPAAPLRARWIKQMFPDANVTLLKSDDLDERDSPLWAKVTIEHLGYKPDAVFTSEDYGDPWADALDSEHFLVDMDRVRFPVSGTMIRKDPTHNLHLLPPIVKAYYMPRVVVLGAESTGTTTLSKGLAAVFDTEWVPEFGRDWGERFHIPNDNWTVDEFLTIARVQNYLEDKAAEKANRVLICDTDAWTTGLWFEYYFGFESPYISNVEGNANNHVLYLVTSPVGVKFNQDAFGMRELRRTRVWFHELALKRLAEHKKQFFVVRGDRQERLAFATERILDIIE
jgi:HTH-type transcriptional repressor of NAD biosynthesis genes